jgi:hypothetical protein
VRRFAPFRVWLTVAALAATPAVALAQSQQYGQTSPQNTYVTWGDNTPTNTVLDVTYFINPGFTTNQINLIHAAANAWSTNAIHMGVNLVIASSAATADIVWNNVPLAGFQLSQNTFNTTAQPGTFPNGSPWVQLTSVTLNVNSVAPWWDGTGPQFFQLDFASYVATLTGRALGLGTATLGTDLPSIMLPDSAYGFGFTFPDTPTATDIAALSAVYGTPEPSTLALFGIGLAAFGLSRLYRRL